MRCAADAACIDADANTNAYGAGEGADAYASYEDDE